MHKLSLLLISVILVVAAVASTAYAQISSRLSAANLQPTNSVNELQPATALQHTANPQMTGNLPAVQGASLNQRTDLTLQ